MLKGFSSKSRVFSLMMTRSFGRSLLMVFVRNSGRIWRCTTPPRASWLMPLITRRWIQIGSRIRLLCGLSGPGSGNRSLFPLTHHDDHYLLLLGEVINEINPERRDRAYPRVI